MLTVAWKWVLPISNLVFVQRPPAGNMLTVQQLWEVSLAPQEGNSQESPWGSHNLAARVSKSNVLICKSQLSSLGERHIQGCDHQIRPQGF